MDEFKRKQNAHPRATANQFSVITFFWTFDLFKKGYKRDLELEDLYAPLDEHKSSLLGDKVEKLWNEELHDSEVKKKEPSFMKVIVKCFGLTTFLYGLAIAVCEVLFKISQPLLMGGLIRYFTPGSNMSIDTAFIYVAALVVCSAANVVTRQVYMMATLHIGMKIRVAVCSLVYRKALKLSMSSLREITIGQSVNLLSNDVNRFDNVAIFLVYWWFGPLQTLIMLYLMWREIDYAALVGVATILLVIPIQAKRTDERIRFMNEIVVAIQVIKMYAWEKPFSHLVALARKREINTVKYASYVRGLFQSFEKFSSKVAIFVSIVMYAAIGNRITAEKMFVVTGFVNILFKAMTDYFPRSVSQIAECIVSVKRIQKFLMHGEIVTATPSKLSIEDGTMKNYSKDKYNFHVDNADNNVKELGIALENKTKNGTEMADIVNKVGIRVSNITAKWSEDLNEDTLTNVNLDVKPGGLVAVIGPVGSGKTSLLHAILRELPLTSGSILVGGTISYASQEPWLFTGSVQQNILFGQPMNKDRYRKVVKVCSLERDFQLFPHGDKTIVGDRGITLSGGQRARINLARAVYKEADLYILDDPLSAVDTHVGRHLFEDCICEFLRNKTRLLVTHQLQYLQAVDSIVILHNGAVEATGTYHELHESDLEFAKQLDLEDDDDDFHPNLNHSESQTSLRSTKRQSSEGSQQSVDVPEPKQRKEMRTSGSVSSGVYKTYCTAGGNYCYTFFVLFICILFQTVVSSADYWMANIEEKRLIPNSTEIIGNGKDSIELSGNWTDSNSTNNIVPLENNDDFGWMPSTETCIYIYTGFIFAIIILSMVSLFSFFTMCMRSSIKLHNKMFTSVIYATMRFFTYNPSGQILNRFAKDMGAIDEILPVTFQDSAQRMLMILGVIIVVAVINYWLLIPTIVMVIFFYLLRVYYGATSPRSPVFSHLNASLQGLTTIRAYGAQALLQKEFDNHQDLHSSAHYLFVAANRAFGLWLDSTCVATGLTGMLQMGVRQLAELENQMTSVERVVEYTTVEKEPTNETPPDKKPGKEWPSKGVVKFDRVFLSYSEDEPAVLKNVNFTSKPSEKIGIVGRTGAGKSSLITALFRLADLSGGSIKIDDIDISFLGLHDLRSKISIIPQEPALFSGSLRENLDPFNQYSDKILWSALEEVELKQAVEDLPAGLSHRVSEGGLNFSMGQRQLLCLARAIIRNNKILVLDEATANVDPQTDELIQSTIRRKFLNCTVLTIAHRLNTIIDSDRILVMDAGSVVEFDHPYILLKNESGYFSKMVQETGHAMAESLFKTAQLKGFKRDLEVDDLYEALDEHKSDYLGDTLEKSWKQEVQDAKMRNKDPNLLKVIVKCFGLKIMASCSIVVINDLCFLMTQPLFLGGLIRYFTPGSNEDRNTAYLYAVGVILCSTITVFVKQQHMMNMLHYGMKIRALKLSKSSLRDTTVGQAVNLLSNDVSRFDRSILFFVYLWFAPIQTIIIAYFVWREIGVASLVGVAVTLLNIPMQAFLGKMLSTYRFRTARRTDERIRLMNEIIVAINVIKMYAWEKPFAQLIALARKHEVKVIRTMCYVRGFLLSSEKFSIRLSIFVGVVMYVMTGNTITAEKMFVVTAYFNILKIGMTEFFPLSIVAFSEALVSVKRIKVTCASVEQDVSHDKGDEIENLTKETHPDTCITTVKGDIRIQNVTAKWSEDLLENTLTNSSLLHAILRELPISKGSISVEGSISYASQEPWLFTGSVRQNILFGQPMNKVRYKKVVKVCALERDLELFPFGDKTLVGERGVTLSGGQRARINLARAVYKEANVYLFDDPLSAVDTHVGRHLFEDCICDFLKNKTRILVTHQLQYLQAADIIIILENGTVDKMGTFSEIQDSGLDFVKQLQADETVSEDATEQTSLKTDGHILQRKASIKSQQSSIIETMPQPVLEMRTQGSVGCYIYRAYCAAGGNCFCVMLVFGFCILAQVTVSGADYWMTKIEEFRNFSNTTSHNEENMPSYWLPDTETCIYVYAGLIAAIIIFAIGCTMSFFKICMKASENLHNTMFESIVRASMWFFNNNPSGQILNRFSKDMGQIDEMLPLSMNDTVQRIATIRDSSSGLNRQCVVADTNSGIVPPLLYATSLLPSHISIWLLQKLFYDMSLEFLLMCIYFCIYLFTGCAFNFLLLVYSLKSSLWTLAGCLVLSFGGDVGLAITQAIGLTGLLQWGIRQSAEMENQMTSVERVLEYNRVDKEPPLQTSKENKLPEGWPSKGEIEFDKMSLTYSKDGPQVLKNISLSINSAEKIGIVGRTGAGKSSLITALFRLADISHGSIKIDGIDISRLGLHDLRSNISIIPQEPALFSGLLRENLDPFSQFSDAVLWSALEEVEMKQAVEDLPAGLSHKVSEGGSNFSVGQRQLLCLARAIIRNNKILVLDEATANEFDHPHLLLEKKSGVLYRMVLKTGHSMEETLCRIAMLSYERKYGALLNPD
ncbi:hypothetical protein C0J52_02251 [Blattella germanica]|nr:hypothetical protein C0J52_02251 [Blattella germanica]